MPLPKQPTKVPPPQKKKLLVFRTNSAMGLPLLVAKEDGVLREPFARIGGVRVDAVTLAPPPPQRHQKPPAEDAAAPPRGQAHRCYAGASRRAPDHRPEIRIFLSSRPSERSEREPGPIRRVLLMGCGGYGSPKFTNEVQHPLERGVAMGRKYGQLSLEDRCEIARLQAEGRSIRQIATALDCAPSTVLER